MFDELADADLSIQRIRLFSVPEGRVISAVA